MFHLKKKEEENHNIYVEWNLETVKKTFGINVLWKRSTIQTLCR